MSGTPRPGGRRPMARARSSATRVRVIWFWSRSRRRRMARLDALAVDRGRRLEDRLDSGA